MLEGKIKLNKIRQINVKCNVVCNQLNILLKGIENINKIKRFQRFTNKTYLKTYM